MRHAAKRRVGRGKRQWLGSEVSVLLCVSESALSSRRALLLIGFCAQPDGPISYHREVLLYQAITMAAVATCTRFSDNYDLKEELGK